MKVYTFRPRHRFIITFTGLFALVLIAALIVLPFLTSSMSHENAEKRVRRCILRELSQQHMAMLQERGLGLPDAAMAAQWKDEIDRAHNLTFVSIKLRRPIPDVLNPFCPTFVVKAVFQDDASRTIPRYFWLSWDGIDRETAKIVWYFSL